MYNNTVSDNTNKKLIETSQRITFEEDANGALIGEMPDSFRITTIGAYHLKRWIGTFTYLDAMVFDTPILDQEINDQLTEDVNSLAIDVRYKRALTFKNYLATQWTALSNRPNYWDFIEAVNEASKSFESVKKAIDTNGR